MSQVVTELTIDADGATRGAQQYARAMDQAAEANEGFNASLQGMAVAIAAGVAGVVAAQAGLRGYIDMVGKINRQFIDLDDSARRAGLSLKEVQQQLFAARSSGVSEKDFFSGLDTIGKLLTDAGRGVTDFGKLFEKNNVSIRNSNGELKSQKQIMADLAGLVQNSAPQVAEGIRRITGLSREWIEHLRQGAQEIDRIAQRAQSAGDLVTRATVDKAREFDREWNKAVAAWDLQFRASIAGILPLLQNLANIAIYLLNTAGKVSSFFMDAATPPESLGDTALNARIEQAEALRRKMVELSEAQGVVSESYKQERQDVSSLDRGLQELLNAKKDLQLRNEKSLLFGDDQADLATADAIIARLKQIRKDREDAAKATKINVNGGNSSTSLPLGKQVEDATNAIDRMLVSLNRHTQMQLADAAAVGLGARAMAEYRAEAAFAAAQTAAGTKATDAQIKEFMRLKKEAGDAAEALARARVESQIRFQSQSWFLDPKSTQIAQQLSQIYGNDVPKALASSEAAAMRLTDAMRDGFQGVSDVVKGVFTAMLTGKNAMDALIAGLDRLADKLANAAFENLLTGALTGNPVQMAIGAAQAGGALIATAFGNNLKLQKAREEWEKAGPAFEKFISTLSGGMQGAISQQFEQLRSQAEQFIDKAFKAGDFGAINRVLTAFSDAVIRETNAFRESFEGMLAGLEGGLGPSSPFASAAQRIKSITDELQGFIDDARISFANDPIALAAGNNPLIAGGGETQVRSATEAAQQYLLSLLGAKPELSATATAIQEMQGTAVALRAALVELGMTSEQAAAAIANGVTAAMDQLKSKFEDDLQRDINDSLGKGYLNEISDLMKRRQQALDDAMKLGSSTVLVDRWFKIQVDKIVDDAGLAGSAIAELVALFPILAGTVSATNRLAQEQAAAQLAAAQSALSQARSDLSSVYEREKSAIESIIDATTQWMESLRKLKNSLLLDNRFTPLNPQQQYLEAQRQYREIYARAMGGDKDAQGQVEQALTTYLEQSRAFNASTVAYYQDFEETQRNLAELEDTGNRQLSAEQQQLAVLNQQVAGLMAINNSVMTVEQAVQNVRIALQDYNQAQTNVNNQRDWGVRPLVNQHIQAGLDAAGISYTGNYGPNSGFQEWVNSQTASVQSIIYAIAQSVPQWMINYYANGGMQNGGIVGAFAGGGMVGNGIFGVDSVLARYAGGGNIALAGGEYVMPAAQTQMFRPQLEAMHKGGWASNDNGAVVAAIGRLESRVANVERNTGQTAQVSAQSGDAIIALLSRQSDLTADEVKLLRKLVQKMDEAA